MDTLHIQLVEEDIYVSYLRWSALFIVLYETSAEWSSITSPDSFRLFVLLNLDVRNFTAAMESSLHASCITKWGAIALSTLHRLAFRILYRALHQTQTHPLSLPLIKWKLGQFFLHDEEKCGGKLFTWWTDIHLTQHNHISRGLPPPETTLTWQKLQKVVSGWCRDRRRGWRTFVELVGSWEYRIWIGRINHVGTPVVSMYGAPSRRT